MPFTALIAQDPAPAAKPQPEMPFLMRPEVMIALFGLFFIVVLLPAQRKQKREAAKLLESIKPGSRVATASGIVGTVINFTGTDEVTIRSEDSKLRVLRSAVTRVLGDEAAEPKA